MPRACERSTGGAIQSLDLEDELPERAASICMFIASAWAASAAALADDTPVGTEPAEASGCAAAELAEPFGGGVTCALSVGIACSDTAGVASGVGEASAVDLSAG